MKIYHNPRCKKSRAGLQYLEEKGIQFEIVKYLSEDAFTVESLTTLLNKMGKSPMDMMRKQEAAYKQEIKGKDFTDAELIQKMTENPKLINRPIIETDDAAVWGDPPADIDEIL